MTAEANSVQVLFPARENYEPFVSRLHEDLKVNRDSVWWDRKRWQAEVARLSRNLGTRSHMRVEKAT
jgi:hypothetical protein